MISLYSLPTLSGAIFSLILGGFILSKNKTSQINIIFSLLCLSIFSWLIAYSVCYSTVDTSTAIICTKIACTSVAFVSLFIYHFVTIFLERKSEMKYVFASYIVTFIFFGGFVFTNFFLNGVHKYFWGFYSKAGFLHPIYLVITYGMWARCFYLLYQDGLKKETSSIRKNQIKYVLIGLVIGMPATVDYIPKYGIEFYPFGFIFVIFFSMIIGFAIIKHHLMDIEVVIRRTAVFAGLFAFVYGVFTVATILGQEFFNDRLGWNQWVAMIPTVLVITFVLRPLELFLTNATEKFLFQKKYDYKELLHTFTSEVLTVLELQKLMDQTVAGLIKIIKLESACVLLRDQDSKVYKVAAGIGIKDKEITFSDNDAVISFLKQTHQPILKDKNADAMDGHSSLKEDFKKLSAQLCLPIVLHDVLTGVLCLGMKKSGEEFTQEDIDILLTLVGTEAIAIANAQLFNELSKTQAEAAQREKMAVIGTLAAGINHEICNPLGIVRGQCEMFLLNLRDGIYHSKDREEICRIAGEIMNKVIKETDRATGITKKLSGFAKPAKKTESEEVFVEKEADEVMALIGHDLKLNNIEFSKKFAPDFPPIFADKRQMQEVLFNIIRNAAQAMDKKSGKIELSGTTSNGTAIIKISDNGSGIPPDKIGQIFNPFFTTKEPGKGTGLGLFIVKQVVERNHGVIAVESQEEMGTTFTLSFPATRPATLAA